MSCKEMMRFLSDLDGHNSLEWMQRHKADSLQAKQAFIEFTQQLIYAIAEHDPAVAHLQAKDLLFRLNRDTRFSRDKSPYNASFRAHISPAGKLPIPVGYFICVKPTASFIGGGMFADGLPKATAMVREYIAAHADPFTGIIHEPEFAAHYSVRGTKLKNVPQGFDKDHPLAESLKHKSWFVEYPIPDSMILQQDVRSIAELCRLMKPFNDYLNEALHGFEMPKR